MTLGADAIKDSASGGSISGQRTSGAVNVPVFPDLGLLVFGRVAHHAPYLCYPLDYRGVIEISQLSHQVGGEVFDGHGSLFDRGEQFGGVSYPTRQRVERIPPLDTGDAGIDFQDRARSLWV